MSKYNKGRLNKPPQDENWCWMTRSMIESEAFRKMGINTRRLIDFLLIEHLAHGGTENGNLKAPYNQLQEFGMTRRLIRGSIKEAELLGFIDVVRGGRILSEDKCSTYRLTWLPTKDGDLPTNRWKFVSKKLREKQNASPTKDTLNTPQEPHKGNCMSKPVS